MKKLVFAAILLGAVVSFISCARGVTPEQAAKGRQKCGRSYVR
jgi:hypothetical protein